MNWSRDYFDTARASAWTLATIDADLQRKHDALLLSAQRYSESRVTDVDPQAAIDAYIDAEMAAEAARAPHIAVLDDATTLLYGPHARAGVAKLFGAKYADVVCMRWLQLMPWRDVAACMGYSSRYCRALAVDAFRFMDSTGESHLRAYNDGELEFIESLKMDGGN